MTEEEKLWAIVLALGTVILAYAVLFR